MEAAITTEPGAAAARPNTPERSAAATKALPLVRHRIPVALLATPLALLALLAYRRLDEAMVAAIMATVLVLVAATDLERRIIPNVVVLPATAIVLLAHISISPARTP